MTSSNSPRPDRSAAVKERIRRAASSMFTEHGFVSTGVREIARVAEVNPALVIRHFGSKEALFMETMSLPASWEEAFDGPIDGLGRRLVRLIGQQRSGGSLKVWAALMRASDRPEVGQTLSDAITHLFADSVAARLDSSDAIARAHIFAAQLEGLLTALGIREDSVLLAMPLDELVERYGAALQRTLTGPVPA